MQDWVWPRNAVPNRVNAQDCHRVETQQQLGILSLLMQQEK
jgi:hypothetical protein